LKWSPWGSEYEGVPYFQVPHKIPRALALCGFGPSESICIFALVGLLRPGSTAVKVSQAFLAEYAGASRKTAQRAISRAISMGLVVIEESGDCQTYDLQKFLVCVTLSVSNVP